jgi:hypothetical protein
MPKHKKDKHAKSIIKGLDHGQAGVPPIGGDKQANAPDSKASQQEDTARRKGSFEGAGQHARTGNPGHQ